MMTHSPLKYERRAARIADRMYTALYTAVHNRDWTREGQKQQSDKEYRERDSLQGSSVEPGPQEDEWR